MVEYDGITAIIHTPLRGSVVSIFLGWIIGSLRIKRSGSDNNEEKSGNVLYNQFVGCCNHISSRELRWAIKQTPLEGFYNALQSNISGLLGKGDDRRVRKSL